MIISHKHNFIFIKPKKVAGTSIEVALAQQCGANDIITRVSEFDPKRDGNEYHHSSQHSEGFYNHMTPHKIREKIKGDIWNTYTKVTIVRNPWDQAVSKLHFQKNWAERKRLVPKRVTLGKLLHILTTPEKYLKVFRERWSNRTQSISQKFYRFVMDETDKLSNYEYYFDENGYPVCDFYIRYEHLQDDYNKLCEILGLTPEILPKLKTKTRKDASHYSTYYTDELKQKVADMCHQEIEYFGYEFEDKRNT